MQSYDLNCYNDLLSVYLIVTFTNIFIQNHDSSI